MTITHILFQMSQQNSLREILNRKDLTDAQRLQMINDLYKKPVVEAQPSNPTIDIVKNYAVRTDPEWDTWYSLVKNNTLKQAIFPQVKPNSVVCPNAVAQPVQVAALAPQLVQDAETFVPLLKCIPEGVKAEALPLHPTVNTRTLSDGSTVVEIFYPSGSLKKIEITRRTINELFVTKMWYYPSGQTDRIETHRLPFNTGCLHYAGRPLRHGQFRSWYPNGTLQFVGEYENDEQKLNTTLHRYNPDGKMAFSIAKDQDGRRLRCEFDQNGFKVKEFTIVSDKKEGDYIEYTKQDNQVITTLHAQYKNDLLDGRYIVYRASEQGSNQSLFEETWYTNGVQCGPSLFHAGSPTGPIVNMNFTAYRRDICPNLSMTHQGFFLASEVDN